MNVIRVCGGLGNQLFQYAFGRAQAYNGIAVSYDTLWYKRGVKERPYRLNKFCTNIKMSFMGRQFFTEKGFNLKLLRIHDRNFSGYWQYPAYYNDILPILKEELQVKEEFYTEEFLSWKEKIINNISTSIHARRGDYTDIGGFGALPFRYYYNAIQKTEGDLYIFSDDIPWCEDQFKQDYFSRKVTFIHLEDYLDFELTRLCKYNIIANSSFSWWAGYLNDNPEKVVITPYHWLNEKRVDTERYPKDWIRLIY